MAVEIKFFGPDATDVRREIQAFLDAGASIVAVVNEAGKAEVVASKLTALPGRGRKPSQKTDPKQVDLEEAIAAKELNDDISDVGVEAEIAEENAADNAAPVSKDDVRTKLIELMKAKGEDAPTKLLSDHFKVSKIGELKETDYAAVVQKADEAIKGK